MKVSSESIVVLIIFGEVVSFVPTPVRAEAEGENVFGPCIRTAPVEVDDVISLFPRDEH